jgi:SAM-dependent methyltransferase/predicted transcriptional regulator
VKPTTTDQVFELLDASFTAAALAAALELGLFRLLDERPLAADAIGERFGIPRRRCRYWLQLLEQAGLLARDGEGLILSPAARAAILEAYAPESWAHLALETRGLNRWLTDFTSHLTTPGSAREALGLARRDYLADMIDDPSLARRFTGMLRDFHLPMAGELAPKIGMDGVDRMMDLGGGSGIFSLALLRRHPRLTAVVVDVPPVCTAARELAGEGEAAGRITWHEANFLEEALPGGFDLVLECDVDVYGEALFRKVRGSLNPGGRFVIVDQLAPAPGTAPPVRAHWALQHALDDPDFTFLTSDEVETLLCTAGFTSIARRELTFSTGPARRFTDGMVMIEAAG